LRARAAGLAIALCWPGHPARASGDESYELLLKRASMMFDYGRYEDAWGALSEACNSFEAEEDPDCFEQLARAATAVGRIGEAIQAWDRCAAIAMGHGDEPRSADAAARAVELWSTWGILRLQPPPGRTWPTRPLVLQPDDPILDPVAAARVRVLADEVKTRGLTSPAVWLPIGRYRVGGVVVDVVAGPGVDLSLPRRQWARLRPARRGSHGR
jgi:hypothetical protein